MAKRDVAHKALTREPQYQALFDHMSRKGVARLGIMNNQVWHDDPRRFVFTLARYKFVSKLLSGRRAVLEIGCGDGFASRIVKQEVRDLTLIDFDPLFIEDIRSRMDPSWPMNCAVHDMMAGPFPGTFDAAYSLDVLEHIPREAEDVFLANATASLSADGVLIVGMPSLESQAHASPQSKEGHINCKSGKELKGVMEKFFHNVFLFSMNDEVVHTGFYPMAHYLLAVCTTLRETGGRAPPR